MNLLKKLIPFYFIVLFCGNLVWAQCPQDNITFLKTQDDVDNFAVLYPDCTELENRLNIGSSFVNDSSDITDLSPLSQVTSIGGGLGIAYNDNLADLNDLENLTSTGEDLTIVNNPSLVDLNGLNNLTSIEGSLTIDKNSGLVNLSGLNNLTLIGGSLYIDSNINLVNLSGLDNLTSVEEQLWIGSNTNLVDLNGLNNLTSIGAQLSVLFNDNLMNFNGLGNLISVEEHLWIKGNDNLSSLSGLENLTSIGDYINIEYNPSLNSLSGLESLTSIDYLLAINNNANLYSLNGLQNMTHGPISKLEIKNNPLLSACNFLPVCSYLASGGFTDIQNNASGCNSVFEISDLCPTNNSTTTITNYYHFGSIPAGTVYQIFNTSGQIIQEGEAEGNLSFNISLEAPGMYFIRISVDDTTLVRRVVKM